MQPDVLEELVSRINDIAESKPRVIVAIVGPPGAGKSTITEALADMLENAAVLPMDGFHLDNDVLVDRGLLHRKGAPQTFDTRALYDLLTIVRAGEAVSVPTFDREADCVVPAGSHIAASTRIILVEGNYLLLDAPGWRDLQGFWNLTIALHVSSDVLEQRLTQRWLEHGYSMEGARRKVFENDMLNANSVLSLSVPADVVIRH